MPKIGSTRAHDDNVCGLLPETSCKHCRDLMTQGASPKKTDSAIRVELSRLADAFAEADRKAEDATTTTDRLAAEIVRDEAAEEFWKAGDELADLLLLLFRYAMDHRREALRDCLVALLRPELDPLIEAITELERRR